MIIDTSDLPPLLKPMCGWFTNRKMADMLERDHGKKQVVCFLATRLDTPSKAGSVGSCSDYGTKEGKENQDYASI